MPEIFPDLEALSQAAAALLAAQAREALAARGLFVAALAGGSTPARTYELLAHLPLKDRVEWDRVQLFWGDERCVAPDDPRSNYRSARQALLDRVPLPPENVHPIFCHGDAEAAARGYEELLRRQFAGAGAGFDLALLGLGADGHTASLFPGLVPPPGRWVWPVRRMGEDFWRITLTPEVLNRSRLVVFLVSGRDKAAALKAVLEGDPDFPSPPARLIRPSVGEVRWLADRRAAGLLGRKKPAGH